MQWVINYCTWALAQLKPATTLLVVATFMLPINSTLISITYVPNVDVEDFS